jgi:membrane-bound inhibitor of C-type lysozyme
MCTCHVLLAASTLVMSGCASTGVNHTLASTPSPSTRYLCADGRVVEATYPDANTAQIKIDGQPHTLRIAISADGARYTGDGWQWWTKGMHDGSIAALAPGETIASAPGVACHAP